MEVENTTAPVQEQPVAIDTATTTTGATPVTSENGATPIVDSNPVPATPASNHTQIIDAQSREIAQLKAANAQLDAKVNDLNRWTSELKEEAKGHRLKANQYKEENDALRAQIAQGSSEFASREAAKDGRIAELEVELSRAESELERVKLNLARAKVAEEFSLPTELAMRLSGQTEAELREDARSLSRVIARENVGPTDSSHAGNPPAQRPQATKKYRPL